MCGYRLVFGHLAWVLSVYCGSLCWKGRWQKRSHQRPDKPGDPQIVHLGSLVSQGSRLSAVCWTIRKLRPCTAMKMKKPAAATTTTKTKKKPGAARIQKVKKKKKLLAAREEAAEAKARKAAYRAQKKQKLDERQKKNVQYRARKAGQNNAVYTPREQKDIAAAAYEAGRQAAGAWAMARSSGVRAEEASEEAKSAKQGAEESKLMTAACQIRVETVEATFQSQNKELWRMHETDQKRGERRAAELAKRVDNMEASFQQQQKEMKQVKASRNITKSA